MKSASLNLFLLLQQLTSYLTLSLWLPCSLQLSARQKTNGASTCWLYPGLSRIYPGSSPFHLATSDLLHNKKPMELVAFPRDVPYKQLGPRTVHIFNLDLNASLLSWILKQVSLHSQMKQLFLLLFHKSVFIHLNLPSHRPLHLLCLFQYFILGYFF